MSTKTKNQARGIGLLQNWITKLGGRDNLTPEEKQAYDEYYEVLSRDLDLDDLVQFWQNEVYNLHNQLREAVNAGEERNALQISGRIEDYQKWIDFIQAPDREREALIEHITNSLDTN